MSLIKISLADYPLLSIPLMSANMLLAYYFLSKAMVRLPLSAVFTLWEGTTLFAFVLMGVLFQEETFLNKHALALGLIAGGLLLLRHGVSWGVSWGVSGEMAGEHEEECGEPCSCVGEAR